ncbi:MAG: CDP-diacylglycerol--glycerol-3-phosphate 3-phosphatidyltransferase [Clostridiales bacterium]
MILLNIPNFLTLSRLIIVPIFGMYLFKEEYLIAVLLFVVAGITDVLDGYIARKYNLISNFGKVADPIADKLMQLTALFLLTYLNKIQFYILSILLLKEILMAIGSISLYKNDKYIVSASWYGKLSTVIFYFVIIILIIYGKNDLISNLLIWIAVIFAIFAFYMYSRKYRRIKKS